MLRFLIIEGPAGAGKTYLTTYLEEKYGLAVARGSLPIRKPGRASAPLLSAENDYSKALEAAWYWKVQEQELILVERFVMSQWVYGGIRAVHEELVDLVTGRFRRCNHAFARSLLLTALKELMWRTFDCDRRDPYGFDLHWLILMPPEALVLERRNKCNRTFSFPAQRELEEYTLGAQVLPPKTVHVVKNLAEAEAFMKCWMRGEYDPVRLAFTEPPF